MGASTNAPLILSIFAFYTIFTFLIGLIGAGMVHSTTITPAGTDNLNSLGFLGYVGLFFSGILFSVSEMGVFNIIWVPLGITLGYIVASFFRGSS